VSPVAETGRLKRARKALFGTRNRIGAAFAHARTVHVPPAYGGLRWLTAGILVLIAVLAATGILLSLYYYPAPTTAYGSVRAILADVPFGWLVRGVHRWAADLLLATTLVHAAIVFLRRSYLPPRQTTWAVGFVLLQVVLGFRFTGRILPFDDVGIETARRGLDLIDAVPVLGPIVADWLRGGPEVGAKSLSRFFTTHALILPWAALALLGLHGFLVRRHGLADPRGGAGKGGAR
jgi:quinol-cytochrome oxidoreductase complex cytochrome b subunit